MRVNFINTLTEKSPKIGFFDNSNFAISLKIINFAPDYELMVAQVV